MKEPEFVLEEVIDAFSNWRYNRRVNENIPAHLWEQVRGLMATYPCSKIMRHLKLSTKQLRKKGLIPNKPVNSITSPPAFIKIPFTSARRLDEGGHSLTIQRGDTQLCLSQPSDAQIQLIINTLLR